MSRSLSALAACDCEIQGLSYAFGNFVEYWIETVYPVPKAVQQRGGSRNSTWNRLGGVETPCLTNDDCSLQPGPPGVSLELSCVCVLRHLSSPPASSRIGEKVNEIPKYSLACLPSALFDRADCAHSRDIAVKFEWRRSVDFCLCSWVAMYMGPVIHGTRCRPLAYWRLL